MTQKEYYVENIWRAVSKIHDMQSQRNYETVVHKRTIGEIEAFESKVEKWMNEYREFVDDGVSRKQPRFWDIINGTGSIAQVRITIIEANNKMGSGKRDPKQKTTPAGNYKEI